MVCQRCGTPVDEGTKFCSECGAPLDETVQAPKTEQKKSSTPIIVICVILAALVLVVVVAVLIVRAAYGTYKSASEKVVEEYTKDLDLGVDIPDDVDMSALNEAAENLKNLDLGADVNVDISTPDSTESSDTAEPEANQGAQDETGYKGDLTKYTYADVYVSGNDITVVPNGELNGKTVLYNGKDLDGFLDYIDNVVLEPGRTINRSFFYEILAIMLVDKTLVTEYDDIQKDMTMALMMANNFHDIDVKIKDCYLNGNKASEYHYNVKAYAKDDEWVVDYGKQTVFFNGGKTEYHSDMFKAEYLAVWMVAIDEYYKGN